MDWFRVIGVKEKCEVKSCKTNVSNPLCALGELCGKIWQWKRGK
jgi:hypothetical protein